MLCGIDRAAFDRVNGWRFEQCGTCMRGRSDRMRLPGDTNALSIGLELDLGKAGLIKKLSESANEIVIDGRLESAGIFRLALTAHGFGSRF